MTDGALSGRAILVTGGGRGIGAAVALAVAGAGADVAVHYVTQASAAERVVGEIRELGRDAEAFQADVALADQAVGLVQRAERRFGRLDGLVNNAGIMPSRPFLEIEPEEWEAVLSTNLSACFHTTRAVLPGMLERGRGSIVNIASRLGQVGAANLAHYCAAKAGLMGLTRALAREFGTCGIRVNAVAPGVTETDMTRELLASEEGRRRLAEMPLGRFGTAPEVAEAVVFLLSDASSLFLGQTLNPNSGGYMA